MHTKIKLSILLLFTCISAFPQSGRNTLLGNVFSSSDKPIPYATVAVYALPDSVLVGGTITDTLGAFALYSLRAQTYSLRVTCVGYEPYSQLVEVNARQQKLPAIVLSERATNIDEVKVVGDKRGFRREVDMNVFVPDSQAVAMSVNGLELLKRVPEIRIKPKNNEITVGGSSNVLVLINGSASGRSLQTIKAEDIKKIEVIQNPTAEYDGEVMSVINVILKDVVTQGFSLAANLEYSLFSMMNNSSLQLDYTHNKFRIFAAAALDFYHDKGGNSIREREENGDSLEINIRTESLSDGYISKGWSLQYGFDYRFNEKNIFNFTADYKPSNSHSNEVYSAIMNVNNMQYSNSHVHAKQEYSGEQQNYNAYYQRKFNNDKQNLRFNINFYTLNRKECNESIDTTFYADTTEYINETINTTNRVDAINAKLDYAQPIGEKLTLSVGYQLYNRRMRNTSDMPEYAGSEQKYAELRNSMYLDGRLKLDRFSLAAGLRVEHQSRNILDSINNYQITPLPFFSAMYNLSDKSRLRLSYNRRLTYPHYLMLIPYSQRSSGEKHQISSGNPALKPKKTHSFRMSYLFSDDDMIDVTATLFYNRSTDAIEQLRQVQGGTMISKYENVGRSSSYGVDLSASFVFFDFIDLSVGGDVYHSKFHNTGYSGVSGSTYMSLSTYLPWDMMLSVDAYFDGKEFSSDGYTQMNPCIESIELAKSLFKGKGRLSLVLIEPFIKQNFKLYSWGDNFKDNLTFYSQTSTVLLRFNYFFSKGKKIERIQMERIRESNGIK